MRCYFMLHGHIDSVEVLTAQTDEERIAEAEKMFKARVPHIEGFEVWDGPRFVYRYPAESR
ncbi:MAG TPA: hypothetical protein VHV26_13785 [Rhizomicrobium sp.]|jgi:hypothetical protein|nr:hypothetical protein [Rhizomicrobium sp.]